MWKVCEPVYSSPLNVWEQFFVVFIIQMMLYSVVYNDVISVIRNIVLEWHDLRTWQLSKWQFLDICFVSFSSKNPEEAELEDILNSVVSPSTVSVKIANILQCQTFQNLALPNHYSQVCDIVELHGVLCTRDQNMPKNDIPFKYVWWMTVKQNNLDLQGSQRNCSKTYYQQISLNIVHCIMKIFFMLSF